MPNRHHLALLIAFGTLPICVGARAQQPASQLKATLAKLDEASTHFTSAQADVHKVFYNAIIKAEDDVQDGSIYVERAKSGTEMGIATKGANARVVEYKSGTVRVYNPRLKCYDSVTRPGMDTYLTLGFGGSGKDLAKAWDIIDFGEVPFDGTKTEKLELTPKDPSVKANFTKLTLWVDLTHGVSLKQVFLTPSGDTQTAVYSHIQPNPKKIDKGPYSIKGKPCGK